MTIERKANPSCRNNRRGAVDYASRRGFLRALGLASFHLPFIPLLDAQAQTPRQRLVVVTGHNGVGEVAQYQSIGSGRDFTLGKTLSCLEAHKQDLILFRDFEGRYQREEVGVHPMASANLLTASPATRPARGTGEERRYATRATSISIDQYIADHVGKASPHASLVIGCGSDTYAAGDDLGGAVCYRGASDPVVAETDIFKIFSRLFGDAGNAALPTSDKVNVRAGDQRSVLDAVARDLQRLKGRVGSEDVRRVEAHLEAVRTLEKRLPQLSAGDEGQTEGLCVPPEMPAPNSINSRIAGRFMPQALKLQADMIAAAFTCDLTRVVLWQVGVTTALWPPQFLGLNFTIHDLSHNQVSEMTRFTQRTLEDGYGNLLTKLKEVKEAGAPLLANTAAVWMNEFADGALHQATPMPIIAAGQAAGKWRTGQLIAFPTKRRHSDFLLSLALTFGIQTERFGTDPTQGPVEEMFS